MKEAMNKIKQNVSKVINAKSLAIIGWFIIYTAVIIGFTANMTLSIKTSFDNTIKDTVSEQVKSLTQE